MKVKDALAKFVGDRPAHPAPDTATEEPRPDAPTVDPASDQTSSDSSSGSLDITFSVRDRSTDS